MSIFASLPGLDDGHPFDCGVWVPDEDGISDRDLSQPCTCGLPDAPYRYQGSHVLPSGDDPRGGSIGLALIPSHITRDGRDDQPEDGTPYPWLRLSIDGTDDDPTVLLTPAQARNLAQQLTAWADSAA